MDFEAPTATTLNGADQAGARDLVSDLLPMSEQIGSGMAEQVHRSIPELGTPADETTVFEATEASCGSNVEQIHRLLGQGAEPDTLVVPEAALDYAQSLVQRGTPISVLLRGYRVGHSYLWNRTSQELRNSIDDETVLLSSLESTSGFMFEYVDRVCDQLVAAYHVERDRWVRTAAAVRAETARNIVAGGTVKQRADSARLGYELDRHHVGLILSGEPRHRAPDYVGSLERVAVKAAAALGCTDPLLIPAGVSTLWAWCGTYDAPSPQALLALESYRPPEGIRMAVGRPAHGVEGFRVTHLEAGHAARFWRSGGSVNGGTTTYRAIEVVSLLASDVDRAKRFVAHELGPLVEPTESAARLRSTLLGFLAHGCSHVHAAQALHMHQNTVYNRVRRAEELIGRPVSEHRVELQTALMLAETLGVEVLAEHDPSLR